MDFYLTVTSVLTGIGGARAAFRIGIMALAILFAAGASGAPANESIATPNYLDHGNNFEGYYFTAGNFATGNIAVTASYPVSDQDNNSESNYFTAGNFATGNIAVTASYPVSGGELPGENISNIARVTETPTKPMEKAEQTASPPEKTAGFEAVLAIATISAIYILVRKR